MDIRFVGHATVRLEIGGVRVLTDPFLRARLGPDVPVAVGMRNWHPFIKDALARLAASGVTRVIGIPMAPQFSTLSVQKYIDAATAALPAGVRFEAVESFHTHPMLLDAFAERVRAAQPKADEAIIFTAHALPVRVIEAGDRYADQVAETAAGVAARAGIAKYDCAEKFKELTFDQLIQKQLGVMDIGAFEMCRLAKLPILVFNYKNDGAIEKAIAGEPIGTIVHG